MKHEDIERLVDILANNAISAPADVGVKGYFRNLIIGAELPRAFKQQMAEWTVDARLNATNLVQYALNKGTNPENRRYTTLGSILQPVLAAESGLEQKAILSALIVTYKLFRDRSLLDSLATRFQIPQAAGEPVDHVDYGPDINWRGVDAPELQSWLRPEPDLLDVGFLISAVKHATSVCRIEVGLTSERGTGVLVDNDLVLTYYHVLGKTDDEVARAAPTVKLRFGAFTASGGSESVGQLVELDTEKPLLAKSPITGHDFALLRLSNKAFKLKDVSPADFSINIPTPRSGLNILQHPRGDAMMLAPSSNGVTGAYPDTGHVQYVSRTAPGSSGAPCFDDDWKVVALHHAVRSKMFGVIGEGILMSAIYGAIREFLVAQPS